MQTLGRLTSPDQFEDIVVKAGDDGSVVRVRDIARVELGSQDYTVNAYLNNKVATALVIFQRPGSNALATARRHQGRDGPARQGFPARRRLFGRLQSDRLHPVLGRCRGARRCSRRCCSSSSSSSCSCRRGAPRSFPIVAIPVSLIGTFAVMAAVGITFNTLSLFGLVLAIGIVVDDAIVVVENVERYLRQGMSPKEAAHKTMDEVGSALVAISLVLIGVFLPTAFITGLQGTFYRQFAITIAAAHRDLGIRFADAVAGAGRAAAEAARRAARLQIEWIL